MLDRPSLDFGNGKNSVLSWGHFDLGRFDLSTCSKSSPALVVRL